MPHFNSIADLMAATEETKIKKAREEAQRLKAKIMAAQAVEGAPASRPAPIAQPAPSDGNAGDDIMDDFDFALQAVEMARKSLPGQSAEIAKTAATILMAKRQIGSDDAASLIERAIRYSGK
jgi:delta 1-pyrroline-5-carboxylate dehydrogenase